MMVKANKMKQKFDTQLFVFFFIAYLIAWSIGFTFGVDDEAIRATYSPIIATILVYLPKFAFTISGVILFWYTGQLKEMWTRLTHWRVKWIWYALAYLGPAFLYLASAWISSEEPLSPRFDSSTLWMLTFAAQSGIFTYFLFRGGLGEEIGLRGFALTRLQTRHSPLKASLIIGFWWGLWHLPAWTGRSVLEIAITWLAVLSFSMIFTWFYNHTQSLPIVMLLHAALNSFDDVYENIFPSLVNIDWELPYIAVILLLGIAFAFILNRHRKKEV
jgi:membrane protease YdiL (CAAX protease family)